MKDLNKKAYIFGSIFTLSNKLQAIGDKMDPNITVKQWLLLACISKFEESPTISEIADAIGNSRQNAKKMAAILEREGFLTLKKDKNDARILRVSLTEKCKKYFENRDNQELEFIDLLFNGFDSDLVQGLYKGILKLSENIVEMENIYDKK
jgi:DNA-binding MarR family transcriptional regulator